MGGIGRWWAQGRRWSGSATQVARVVRHRTCVKTGRRSRETVYVITDLTSREASPQRLGKIIRSQWVIENRLRFVRDTAFREDASKVYTERGPENMATFAQLRDQLPPCRRTPQHCRRTPRDVLRAVHPSPGSPRTPLTSTNARTV